MQAPSIVRRPRRLRPGDRVLLVAPSGPASEERIRHGEERCRALGLEPVVAPSARKQHGYFAGTDEERAADLRAGFRDDSITALWAVRGGYGAIRLLTRVDLEPLRRNPKAFIGFSDNTAIHLALNRAGMVSFLGPHAPEDFPEVTDASFRKVLFEGDAPGLLPLPTNRPAPVPLAGGVAEGPLIGGNLTLLASACGTPFSLQTRGAIVLIEDVGDPIHHIDRHLTQLYLAGALDGAAGIAFGHFSNIEKTPNDRPIVDVLREWVEPLGIPAVFDLPFGHEPENWTLPLGARARLDGNAGTLEILEPGVE